MYIKYLSEPGIRSWKAPHFGGACVYNASLLLVLGVWEGFDVD